MAKLYGLRQGTFVLVAVGLVFFSTSAFSTVYVSPGGDNSSGSSWATAYTDVQAGLDAGAARGEDVWVAEATYTLITPLTLGDDVSVYGGFPAAGKQTPHCSETLP